MHILMVISFNHCNSMMNVLSDMVGVWAGLGGGEGARGWCGIVQAVQIHSFSKIILNVLNANILYTLGALASDVFEVD